MIELNNVLAYFNVISRISSLFALKLYTGNFSYWQTQSASVRNYRQKYLNKISVKRWILTTALLKWTN